MYEEPIAAAGICRIPDMPKKLALRADCG